MRDETFELGRQGGITVGRNSACAIVLDTDVASTTHFVIRIAPAGLISIKDYSRTGTRVDGVVVHQRELVVAPTTRIEVGPFVLDVSPIELAPIPPPTWGAPIPPPPWGAPIPPPLEPPPPRRWNVMNEAQPTMVERVVGDRFEIFARVRGDRQRARDRETGEPVGLCPRDQGVFGLAYQRAVHALVVGRSDRRVSRVVWDDPLLFESGTNGLLAYGALALAGLALIELSVEVAELGVSPMFWLAWVPRDGSSEVRVPVAHIALDFGVLVDWLSARGLPTPELLDPRPLAAWLAEQAPDPASARLRVARIPETVTLQRLTIDFDGLILELERALAALPGKSGDAQRTYTWPLAAALHHRACVSAERVGPEHGLPDVCRAVTLDPHPPYWTTRALFEERLGLSQARASHDAAVRALEGASSPAPGGWDGSPPLRPGLAARTWLARGAYRARTGDREGARSDIESAHRLAPTASSERWLAALER